MLIAWRFPVGYGAERAGSETTSEMLPLQFDEYLVGAPIA